MGMQSQQIVYFHPKQLQFDDDGQQCKLSESTQPPKERM